MSVSITEIITPSWAANLVDGSRIGVGWDVATTDKKKSNPNSIAITEQLGWEFVVRFLIRWKTCEDDVALAMCRAALESMAPRRPKRLAIDASSEKFFATRVRRELRSIVPVSLVVNSESTEYLGEKMSYKVYLGNLLVNTIEENQISIPQEAWLRSDIRSVKKDKGSFEAEVDENGNHGDCFDAIKLSLHALLGKGGPAKAEAAQVGGFGRASSAIWKNPLAYLHERGRGRTNV